MIPPVGRPIARRIRLHGEAKLRRLAFERLVAQSKADLKEATALLTEVPPTPLPEPVLRPSHSPDTESEAGLTQAASQAEMLGSNLHVSGELEELAGRIREVATQLSAQGQPTIGSELNRIESRVCLAGQIQLQYKVVGDVVDLLAFDLKLRRRGLEEVADGIQRVRETAVELDGDLEACAEEATQLGRYHIHTHTHTHTYTRTRTEELSPQSDNRTRNGSFLREDGEFEAEAMEVERT